MLDKRKIVFWGHTSPLKNTYFYIHMGYEKAARHLGYETRWLPDEPSQEDFSNSIIFAETQEQNHIPICDSSFYVLHNVHGDQVQKYDSVRKQVLNLQVFCYDTAQWSLEELAPCVLFSPGMLFQPWATDLLPYEIDANKPGKVFASKVSYFVGTSGRGEFGNYANLDAFGKAAASKGVEFRTVQGISQEESIRLIKESYMAPTIVGEWQQKHGYVPCRIFKNISYGQPGFTNSPIVRELFKNEIVFNENCSQLFFDARAKFWNISKAEIIQQMDYVRDNHTYINRLNTILSCLERTYNA